MPIHPILIPVLVVLSVVGAFGAGRYVGSSEAEGKYLTVSEELTNRQNVEALFMLNSVSSRLREGKIDEANLLLTRFSQLQVPGVVACSKSPMCTLFAGKHMPSEDELKRVGALGDPVPASH